MTAYLLGSLSHKFPCIYISKEELLFLFKLEIRKGQCTSSRPKPTTEMQVFAVFPANYVSRITCTFLGYLIDFALFRFNLWKNVGNLRELAESDCCINDWTDIAWDQRRHRSKQGRGQELSFSNYKPLLAFLIGLVLHTYDNVIRAGQMLGTHSD